MEEIKIEESKIEEESKPDIDVELAMRQIRKGWSVYDAGELTIGDLYLMVNVFYYYLLVFTSGCGWSNENKEAIE